MSVHLVGGGWDSRQHSTVYGPFVAEAATRAALVGRAVPRISVLTVGDSSDHADQLVSALQAGGPIEAVLSALVRGQHADSASIADIDGIVIGGGLTPAYLSATHTIAPDIRRAVASGTPYLGFSAGAMIAATPALVGGWLVDGVQVCQEDASEDLEEVTVERGIGLVDVAVEVHTAQWGTLSRLVAAIEHDRMPRGYAIDENTALIVDGDSLRSVGAGNVWTVTRTLDGVLVGTLPV
jgi:cyanophycinase